MFLLALTLIMYIEMVEREKHAKAQNGLDSIRKKKIFVGKLLRQYQKV